MQFKLPAYSDYTVLCCLALLVPTIATIAPLQIASVAVLSAIVVISNRIVSRSPQPFSPPKLVWILATIIIWAIISSTWALDSTQSIATAARLILAVIALIVLLNAANSIGMNEKKMLYRWLSRGGILAIVITLFSIAYIYLDTTWIQGKEMADHELNTLNRSASILALFAWPWALSIGRHYSPIWAIIFIVTMAVTIYLLPPVTPLLALLIGTCAFAVAWTAPRCAKPLIVAAIVLSVGIIPFLNTFLPYIVGSLDREMLGSLNLLHRFVIWEFAAEQILERPLIGWGLDAARAFPNGDTNILIFESASGGSVIGQPLPLHPHNAIIQIWLELGFVGVLLFCSLLASAIHAIPQSRPKTLDAAICIAVLATAITIAQLGYGFWQGWWLSALGLATITTTAAISRDD